MDFFTDIFHWLQSLEVFQWVQSLAWVSIVVLFTTMLTLFLGVSSYFIFKLNNRKAKKGQMNSSAQFYRRIYFDSNEDELIKDGDLVDDGKTTVE